MIKRKNEEQNTRDVCMEMVLLANFVSGELVRISDRYDERRSIIFETFIRSLEDFSEKFDLEALSEEDF